MDDILASIRRILNEEEAAPPDAPASIRTAAAGQAEHPPGGEPDVFELDQSMMLPDADPPATSHGPVPEPPPVHATDYPRAPDAHEPSHESPFRGHEPEPEPDLGRRPEAETIRAITVTSQPHDASAAGPMDEHLVAPAAAAAAANSVGALMRTLVRERGTQVSRGGPTIEDLVRDEMRPILKEWLDNHLPPMVERLVRAEIERVMQRMT